ncbi:polysaccharide deacetylase family protein [Haliangium sp.]|uniref:polysaccharide deacetylase family protein n=1 Tax=Haliangium sp. TaxID=2663208 RepID=UPI003D0A3DA6
MLAAIAAAALVAVAALVHESAWAGRWPKPAGGPSASGGPEVVFTFDDGPHYQYTRVILDELRRRNIKAIFFWVGHRVTGGGPIKAHLRLVDRAVREGHLIANHTINHANLCQVDRNQAAHEIDENGRIYENLTGLPQILFRSPYGARCRQLVRLLEERSLQHFHWDIDPQEWEHHDTELLTRYVIGKLSHLEGRAVLLMHDTKPSSAQALPRILDWIERENEERRRRGHKLPIRILDGADLMAERIDPTLPHWIEHTGEHSLDVVAGALDRLLP